MVGTSNESAREMAIEILAPRSASFLQTGEILTCLAAGLRGFLTATWGWPRWPNSLLAAWNITCLTGLLYINDDAKNMLKLDPQIC